MDSVTQILNTVDLQIKIIELEAEIRLLDDTSIILAKQLGRAMRMVERYGMPQDDMNKLLLKSYEEIDEYFKAKAAHVD